VRLRSSRTPGPNAPRGQPVAADITGAWDRIDEAKRHLESSAKLATTDDSLAYVALQDASRNALTPHMQANGYRATNRPGAHQAVGLYGEATIATGKAKPDVDAFDRMRQVRNRSEYGSIIGQQLLATDLDHAREIVAAVETSLPPRPQP